MNNFQVIVSQFFEWETSVVARWPLPFLVLPPLLTVFLVVAAASDFELNTTNETLQIFLPDSMESISDFKKLISLFPPRDAQRDTYSVFGSKFASILFEDNGGNAVSPQAIEELAKLHRSIIKLKVKDNISFSTICLRHHDSCALHPLGYALEDDEPVLSVQFLLRYPMLRFGDLSVDNALVFGDVQVDEARKDEEGNASIELAKAVRLFYLLEPTMEAESWIDVFLEHMANYQSNSSRIFYTSSKSLGSEMERNGALLIPWMPWAALILIIFCMISCSSRDVVRFVEALTETAASLFLTSLTDGLSFSIGSVSDFYAVRVFCTYCAMAILFMFLFQVTFFNAVMVLCCRRELAGRHSLLCYRVPKKEPKLQLDRRSHPTKACYGAKLAKIVSTVPAKIIIVIVYVVYLAASINYALVLPLGLDLKLLAPLGSYAAEELRAQERLFRDYGPYCFAVVHLQNKSLGNPEERKRLLQLYDNLSSSRYASKAEFWLEDFESANRNKAFSTDRLNSAISKLLTTKSQFKSDIRFNLNGDIEATKMLLRIRSLNPSNDKPRAEYLRSTIRNSGFDGFAYDTR
ncbi:unnamed protein product [Cylicocyclus nassatus]|uniref:SSD domain-containing protein n=1 Tax=Cylicocyclus nassatus TaxID=53992 RepID=A0AA36GWN8_CYLNA|nr:unnamed protein product [Cylicocyclus nassatus]